MTAGELAAALAGVPDDFEIFAGGIDHQPEDCHRVVMADISGRIAGWSSEEPLAGVFLTFDDSAE